MQDAGDTSRSRASCCQLLITGRVISKASLADAHGKIKSFEKISAGDGMRNASHNKNVGKDRRKPRLSLSKRWSFILMLVFLNSLKSEATVGPLAICMGGRNGADVVVVVVEAGA